MSQFGDACFILGPEFCEVSYLSLHYSKKCSSVSRFFKKACMQSHLYPPAKQIHNVSCWKADMVTPAYPWLLSVVLLTHGQSQSKNTKWKITETNNL
jgi:hypothetical protein